MSIFGSHSNISRNIVAKRRGEHFSRMAPAAVARLFKKSMHNESVFELGREKENEWETMSMCSEAESVASVANSIVTVAQETIKPKESNFLILDTRDRDAYEELHIVDAVHCPA